MAVPSSVDTTLVSALHGDGGPRRGVSERDGVALMAVRNRKEQILFLQWRSRQVFTRDKRVPH